MPRAFGALIGEVTLVGWTLTSPSPWAERDAVHWLLEDPVEYDHPIPCRGQLGLFVPDVVL